MKNSALGPPGDGACLYSLPLFQPHIPIHSSQRNARPVWFLRSFPRRLTHQVTPTRSRVGGPLGSPTHLHTAQTPNPLWKGSGLPDPVLEAAHSPPGRWRCGRAGCFCRASRSRNPGPPAPPVLLGLEPHVQRRFWPRWRLGWDLRLGARHGPAGRDARVPGGAETAAERAADPGVRPGVGVWAPGPRASLASLLPGKSPPPEGGWVFEFLLSSCLELSWWLRVECALSYSPRSLPPSRHHLAASEKCSLSPRQTCWIRTRTWRASRIQMQFTFEETDVKTSLAGPGVSKETVPQNACLTH